MKAKNYFINILTCLVSIIILAEVAWAADSAYIAVTCSIPEIPGLNAPLIETKTLKVDMAKVQENIQKTALEQGASTNANTVTVEKEIILSQNNQPAIVETSYSR